MNERCIFKEHTKQISNKLTNCNKVYLYTLSFIR